MTIALITDQHLDGRKGNIVFWEYFKKFYDEVFFPTLEKKGITTVIDLGDTFDNRKSIDFNVWQRVKEYYFDKLNQYGIEVHMILGNHDTYYKNTNDVNSPGLLVSQYNNVLIYDKPDVVYIEQTPIAMIPWINAGNYDKTMEFIKTTTAKIAMGHLELNGFEVTPGMLHEGGMDPEIFSKFKQVFSGHFHHRSSRGNITYLGNPYQMFWNDYKDPRGFHLYEPMTNKLKFVKNPYEIFTKIYYDDTKDLECNFEEYKNTFIKLIVEKKSDYFKFEKFVDNLYQVGIHDLKIIENFVDKKINTDVDINLEVTDTLSLLNEYIDEVEMTVNKSQLKDVMRSLYIESCEVV